MKIAIPLYNDVCAIYGSVHYEDSHTLYNDMCVVCGSVHYEDSHTLVQ